MKNTILRYGLIAGATMLLINLVPLILMRGKAHQYEWGEVLGYTGMVLGLSAIYFGIRHYRDHRSSGSITFGRALRLGLLISVVASLLFVLADTLYVTVIDPDFCATYPAQRIEKLEAQNAPPEEIQKVKDMAAMMAGPGGIAILEVIMFFTVFFIGLGISLISSLILKRAPAAPSGS